MARIAVIGAGMGALAAAARLATGGHRAVVHERSRTYGGGIRRFERDGFGFDTGPGLLHLPAVYRDLFVKTGKEPLEHLVTLTQVDPASRHVFADGTAVSLPNASRAGLVDALDAAFGAGAGERWSELMVRAREVWEATRRPLLEDALAADSAPLNHDPYPGRRRGLLRRREPTLAEVARSELRDPRLAAVLEHHALAYGYDPRFTPASATVLPYMEQTFGTWYVGGGIRALADAVYDRCVARGVDFHFGAEVTGIVEKDGRAAGVELADGTRTDADVVVAGVAPQLLYPMMLRAHATPWRGEQLWGGSDVLPEPGGMWTGRFTVCLALRGPRPAGAAHRTVVHTPDRLGELNARARGELYAKPTVTVLRPDDAALRPDDAHEAVTLGVTVRAHDPAVLDWTRRGLAEEYADTVLAAASAALPELAARLLWRAVHTPADTLRETGAPGGAVPGPALAGADGNYLRSGNSVAPGLYAVGGFSHPGGGLAHTGMSGAIVADLISGGPGGSR